MRFSKSKGYRHVAFLKKLDGLIGSYLIKFCRFKKKVFLENPRSFLIIRPGGIGDAVVLIPIIVELKKRFPEATITILGEKRNISVFFPLCGSTVKELFCYDKPFEFIKVFTRHFDVVIDTEQWHYFSAFVAFLAGFRGMRIGFATNSRAMAFTNPVDYDEGGFEGINFFRLVEPLGIFWKISEKYANFYPIKGVFKDPKRVVLFPGASIDERKWPVEKFKEVALWLCDRGFSVVVVGGKEDIGAGEFIVSGLKGAKNMAGMTSLEETSKILASSRVVLSSDSGIMHLAVAVGTPVVALFGPGIESKWAPKDGVSIVINKRLSCSPCTKFGYTPPCPKGAECIKLVEVEEVKASLERILERT